MCDCAVNGLCVVLRYTSGPGRVCAAADDCGYGVAVGHKILLILKDVNHPLAARSSPSVVAKSESEQHPGATSALVSVCWLGWGRHRTASNQSATSSPDKGPGLAPRRLLLYWTEGTKPSIMDFAFLPLSPSLSPPLPVDFPFLLLLPFLFLWSAIIATGIRGQVK